jgi:uncharacterized membrane protein
MFAQEMDRCFELNVLSNIHSRLYFGTDTLLFNFLLPYTQNMNSAVNKFGKANEPDQARTASDDASEEDSGLTNAVVSIKLSIEGDSTTMPNITYRQNLRDALERIAADAQVEDCLVSAEILWSPEEKNDRLTSDDIYASYPDLIPL